MKKIFIITGEPSGDKLASKVISKLQKDNPNIQYSCVGGTHLYSLGIKSIFELKEITYIGFTSVTTPSNPWVSTLLFANSLRKICHRLLKIMASLMFFEVRVSTCLIAKAGIV